ncbi:MAG: hypothetical protein P4L40_05375 [Terracidiphilus sp.]|nr:hypothetical protein [Terracidiphilus sp.]
MCTRGVVCVCVCVCCVCVLCVVCCVCVCVCLLLSLRVLSSLLCRFVKRFLLPGIVNPQSYTHVMLLDADVDISPPHFDAVRRCVGWGCVCVCVCVCRNLGSAPSGVCLAHVCV